MNRLHHTLLCSLLCSAFIIFIACSTDTLPLASSESPAGGSSEETVDPWLFAEFLAEIDATSDPDEQTALVDSFMAFVATVGFPLREDTLCHYLYRGDPDFPFVLAGDMNGWSTATDYFNQAGETDLYYVSHAYPPDARLDYKFVLNRQWILDPLNPFLIWGGFGPNSELRMPEYIYPSEIDFDPDIDHGVVESHSFSSDILNNTRTVEVYLPVDYEMDTLSYPAIYVQDGGEYITLASMVNVLDNLIAAGEIQPVVAVFVDPVNRTSEYWMNDDYVAMLVEELIPFLHGEYRLNDSPSERAIMGASLGGLISLYAGYLHPEVFGLTASQSGSFWVNNQELADLFAAADPLPLDIYLDWGTFETGIMNSNYDLIEVLEGQGYELTTSEYPEGHSWGNWRAHLDNILETYWSTGTSGIE